ncbi:DUF1192 domain-containing protein [Oricola indica]|jgi:uncharacterized small protein (DUF1192 family)|uniref:DUF1192 domain-containing protein n=1 Tax=Oricola indica TaxID=2872591 RepID=UPI001CBB9DB6|nr:DUF1192 domain-containing protein [Oricola indica]
MDEEEPKRKPAYQLGQDISLMSVDELNETIDALGEEIARLKREVDTKSDSRNAAEAFFKL